MNPLFLILSLSAICVMLYGLYRVINLHRKVLTGGEAKDTWKTLSLMIVLFVTGYLATPFFPYLPGFARDIVIGIIFLFGSIFVVIVINLFYKIVSELGF